MWIEAAFIALVSVSLGSVIGITLSIISTLFPLLRVSIVTVVVLLASLPLVATPYFFNQVYLLGNWGTVIFSALPALGFTFEYSLRAFARSPREHIWLIKSSGMGRFRGFFEVALPHSAPFVVRSVQQAIPVSVLYVLLYQYFSGIGAGRAIVGAVSAGTIIDKVPVIILIAFPSILTYWVVGVVADRMQTMHRDTPVFFDDQEENVGFIAKRVLVNNVFGVLMGVLLVIVLWQVVAITRSYGGANLLARGPLEIGPGVWQALFSMDRQAFLLTIADAVGDTMFLTCQSIIIGGTAGMLIALVAQHCGKSVQFGTNVVVGTMQSVPIFLLFPIYYAIFSLMGFVSGSLTRSVELVTCLSVSFYGVYHLSISVLRSIPKQYEQLVKFGSAAGFTFHYRLARHIRMPRLLQSLPLMLIQLLPLCVAAALTVETLLTGSGLGGVIEELRGTGGEMEKWTGFATTWLTTCLAYTVARNAASVLNRVGL